MKIRSATLDDVQQIKSLYLQAFDMSEAELVAKLAVNLFSDNNPEVLSLAAIENEEIVGHIAFSPVCLASSTQAFASILAPLAVLPHYQKKGIGSALIQQGLDMIRQQGLALVFVYGDPAYYCRFGFNAEMAKPFLPCYHLQYPHGWLALRLNDGALPQGGEIRCVEALSDADLW